MIRVGNTKMLIITNQNATRTVSYSIEVVPSSLVLDFRVVTERK
jgi:hypothetical protein